MSTVVSVAITVSEARQVAHAALDRWLDELESSWSTVLTSSDAKEIAEASVARPDLPDEVRNAVGNFVGAVIHAHEVRQ